MLLTTCKIVIINYKVIYTYTIHVSEMTDYTYTMYIMHYNIIIDNAAYAQTEREKKMK